jgi:hypothetical protein
LLPLSLQYNKDTKKLNNMQGAPKFSKVEVMLRDSESTDKYFPKTTTLTFHDAGLVITGDYLVVVVDEKNEIENTISSTGQIYELKDVRAYRTHKE